MCLGSAQSHCVSIVADSAEATGLKWAAPAGGGINPNIIINGNFTINQRSYTTGTNLASGAFGFDRWKSNYTNTSLTFTSAPQGQSVTISVDGVIRQIIERANVDAGTYVLSFSGTATGRIYNVGATPPSYAASPISFTADGLADVIVEFTAVSTTKTLSKVKLELGSTASAFVFCGGDIAGELAECQRYFYNHVSGNSKAIATAFYSTGTLSQANIKFPSTMRTTPTLIATSGSNYYGFSRTAGDDYIDDLTINMAAESNANVYNAGQSSGTQGDAGFFYTNNASASISFSAEI